MSEEGSWSKFDVVIPANYKIAVSGHLEETWSEQLGMALSYAVTSENDPITILTGELNDQAALFGVLNGLYNFGFPLLYVKCIQQTDHLLNNHKPS